MVAHTRYGLGREKVTAGGLEECRHRLVFKRGRVGEVDHHLRAGYGLFEPLAGDAVEAAARVPLSGPRRRERRSADIVESGHLLPSHQPTAPRRSCHT